jgi:hypothetical protein
MEPKLKVMYFPSGLSGIINGFTTFRSKDHITISLVDPDLVSVDSDVSSVVTDALEDPHNGKFLRCLVHAKSGISDSQWDAIRRTALQIYKVPSKFIRNSRSMNKLVKEYEIC